MDNDNGRPPDAGEEPVELVTVNQIVAWNMAYFRRVAGITQEQLGKILGGRPKTAISADERSWDGKRTREFNAHEITHMADALGVPIIAFFLPPEDDGLKARYLFADRHGDYQDMSELMTLVMPDLDGDETSVRAYRERFRSAAGRYLDPSWMEELDRWLGQDAGDPDMRAERAARIRQGRDVLAQLASDMDRWADALEKPGDDS